LQRYDNEILFEELNHRALPTTDYTLSNMAAVIVEKSNDYWLYHKTVIEDDEEEKLMPADKVWFIVKYVNHQSITESQVPLY